MKHIRGFSVQNLCHWRCGSACRLSRCSYQSWYCVRGPLSRSITTLILFCVSYSLFRYISHLFHFLQCDEILAVSVLNTRRLRHTRVRSNNHVTVSQDCVTPLSGPGSRLKDWLASLTSYIIPSYISSPIFFSHHSFIHHPHYMDLPMAGSSSWVATGSGCAGD